ncbi:hypothetical protein Gogos_004986, partial [Gossypium gossypioides]|nr:hypothetical protein [Gossypium gossypioides]
MKFVCSRIWPTTDLSYISLVKVILI